MGVGTRLVARSQLSERPVRGGHCSGVADLGIVDLGHQGVADEPIGEVFAYWTHNTVTGDLVIGYVQPEVRTLTSNAPQPLHLSEAVDDLGGGRVFIQFRADRDLGRLVLTVDDVEVIPDFQEDR